MNIQRQWKVGLAVMLAVVIGSLPAAVILRAERTAKPMMTHDFIDVPVAGKEFMEPYINEFYHRGITGGCSVSPLMYCPEDPVTRGSMAVFMGRALGYVEAEAGGINARAYFNNTNSSPIAIGVYGRSIEGMGVYGTSETGAGVFAKSYNSSALVADSVPTNSTSDSFYDILLAGSVGEIHAQMMHLATRSNITIDLDENDDGTNNSLAVREGDDNVLFLITENGAVTINGDLTINGDYTATGTKSAIVDTVSYGDRLMYAVESPENWFEDFGSAQLVDGEAVITINPMFAETVNLSEDYHVFAMPVDGWSDLYVTDMTATSFTVRSADGSDVKFSYRIIAKRLGYEDMRMEEVED